MTRVTLYCLLICLLVWRPALALEVAGVELPDQVQIAGVDRPLLLNGAGVRKKFFISVYVGALYLPQRQVGVGDLLEVPTANRVAMHFVHSEVAKHKMDDAWRSGFAGNLARGELDLLEPRLEAFTEMFRDLRRGDTVWLDFVPGGATTVSINGVRQGEVTGDDFNRALLSVWLGDEPVTAALKKALVGVDKH